MMPHVPPFEGNSVTAATGDTVATTAASARSDQPMSRHTAAAAVATAATAATAAVVATTSKAAEAVLSATAVSAGGTARQHAGAHFNHLSLLVAAAAAVTPPAESTAIPAASTPLAATKQQHTSSAASSSSTVNAVVPEFTLKRKLQGMISSSAARDGTKLQWLKKVSLSDKALARDAAASSSDSSSVDCDIMAIVREDSILEELKTAIEQSGVHFSVQQKYLARLIPA
jgi:hypothetical protein